jgi:hypothetical protein
MSYATKRRLFLTLTREKKWLEGTAFSTLEKGLRDVMTYRNALTHGAVIEKDEGTVLEYFDNGPQSKVLSDDYWDRVVATFKGVEETILRIKASASTSSGGTA